MSTTVVVSRMLRVIGLCILLIGLYHLVAIFFMTSLGRSQLLFTYIVFGAVLNVLGVWLLRGDLTALFHPSRYDIVVGLITLIALTYFLSWIFGKGFWQSVMLHSPLSVARMRPLVGLGFLLTFAVASCAWIAHVIMVSSAWLREWLRPSLLSHLGALLLFLPSLRLGSQIPTILDSFLRQSAQTTRTSSQTMQPTPKAFASGLARRRDAQI